MHCYDRKTGEWRDAEGKLLGIGYSGKDDGDGIPEPGEGKNDPSKEAEKGVGPLPAGHYWIGKPFTHPTAGPFVMRLDPMPGTKMYARGGMLIHGEGRTPGAASRGCIILNRSVREAIRASGDNQLLVM